MRAPLILLAILLPLVPAEASGCATCGPCWVAHDPSAVVVPAHETYYLVQYQSLEGRMILLWQETNDLAGLQTSPGMSCGAPIDTLVWRACVGHKCPPPGA